MEKIRGQIVLHIKLVKKPPKLVDEIPSDSYQLSVFCSYITKIIIHDFRKMGERDSRGPRIRSRRTKIEKKKYQICPTETPVRDTTVTNFQFPVSCSYIHICITKIMIRDLRKKRERDSRGPRVRYIRTKIETKKYHISPTETPVRDTTVTNFSFLFIRSYIHV